MSTVAPVIESSSCHRLLDILEAEAVAVCGSRERIESGCAALRNARIQFADVIPTSRLTRLAEIVNRRVAAVNAPIIVLLCEIAETLPDPWSVLERLLDSSDTQVVTTALHSLARAASGRPSLIDDRALHGLAARADRESGPFTERATLEVVASILHSCGTAFDALCSGAREISVRRLAARLLDLGTSPPTIDLADRILGPETAAWLAPYLSWTRATHLDLLALAAGAPAITLASFQHAQDICGPNLLRQLAGEIGWPNLNLGFTVRRFVGVSVGGSFPLLLSPVEAQLLEDAPDADGAGEPRPEIRQTFDRLLIVAQGGETRETASPQDTAIARFRTYNLAHAELLGGFLDVTPLTLEKVRTTVERMDRIVEDFQLLFSSCTDECPALAAVYGGLKEAIEHAVATETPEPGRPLSAELTRLVEMFEDPQQLSDVHTLHGLKRYLHQRGLKLGMLLAESGRSANRTVTLALATSERVLQISRAVMFVDFEPEDIEDERLPYPVQLVIDEFSRQLVHAEQALPKVKVFCYGNEVHYFIAYRNHPAFVRIDFSPPARGGMIDLSYFGVSKYELADHPDTSLPGVERFFRRLDFDVQIDTTHVHARYDKERAFDLADLCEKAASLFRLAPYLMDIDWIIGDLALSAGARGEVATAWSDFFARWGVLPYPHFLTADRCGILTGIDSQPAGDRELRWNGEGTYRDRLTTETDDRFWDLIRSAIERRHLRQVVPFDGGGAVAQLAFEDRVLVPLRHARRRGEVIVDGDMRAETLERFERRHPAECLAGVLQSDAPAIERSARLADIAALLSRGLRFRTSGAINGYEVQFASLPLPGRKLGLYVLRDASGIFRLAIAAAGDSLHLRREAPEMPWQENWSVDPEPVVALLRRANYPTAWPPAGDAPAPSAILELFGTENTHASLPPLPGERLLSGIAASPGRAVGPARLGLVNRTPTDVERSIVICPSMSPADGAFIARSGGVVSTGGGALSHAGLLALQYGKPAMIVSGLWESSGTTLSALVYRTLHYDERQRQIGDYRVTERHQFREREERLREGDLVVLDADEGLLRILGPEADGLALHGSLRQLDAASRQLAAATSDPEVLIERGRRLRARHQLERVLGRITSAILARHAVSELMLRDSDADTAVAPSEKGQYLAILLGNRTVGRAARDAVHLVVDTLTRRLAADKGQASRLIPDCPYAWEVLSLQLDVRRLASLVAATRELLAVSGITFESDEGRSSEQLQSLATARLQSVRAEMMRTAKGLLASGDVVRLRHVINELERIDVVLGTEAEGRAAVARLSHSIARHDRVVHRQIAGRRILDAGAGGIELRAAVGSKAANLAEVARIGLGAHVPSWFVVTDCAFREALEAPVVNAAEPSAHASTVLTAVDEVLLRTDLTNAQKSSIIRQIWDGAQLPDDLVADVRQAYRRLTGGEDKELPFVAVRSSASEEDLEAATRAGEFDTFLFVRGEEPLLAFLKRAWSGLWSERALHNRAVLGMPGSVGGGIVVQRMISSRASGVLHTVNVAERRLREMVINAGLGIGEGIVSGAVAADRIVVSKEGDLHHGQLRFRYLTADKRERVVFNSRLGSGTARVETLYHQRLRPALEYVEICQLVRAAARLEEAYRYPLDIEFAVEGTALFLLQVRPIPTPIAVWRDTIERWPLASPQQRISESERLEEA